MNATTATYNGWTNKQTWNINLMYQEVFTSMCEDQEFDDMDHLAGAFESIVDELEFQDLRDGSLAHQAVGDYLDAVNWTEIAEHFAADCDLFTEDKDEDSNTKGLCELLAEAEQN